VIDGRDLIHEDCDIRPWRDIDTAHKWFCPELAFVMRIAVKLGSA